MRNVHRCFLLGASLTLATVGYAQTTTPQSPAAPCYGSTAAPPSPTPSTPPSLTGTPGTGLSTPNALSSSLTAGALPQSVVPQPVCNPSSSAPPPPSTNPPPATESQPNTLGGVTVQPTNPNLSIGGLPSTTSP